VGAWVITVMGPLPGELSAETAEAARSSDARASHFS
jgi:hypothetical protein